MSSAARVNVCWSYFMRFTSSTALRRYVFVTYLKRSHPVLYKLASPQAGVLLMFLYISLVYQIVQTMDCVFLSGIVS